MKRLSALTLLAAAAAAHADPQLDSWFTDNSGKYARIYQTTANETARTTSTTWTRGQGTQSNPVYADINEIRYSANWVYIRAPGLASHVMGPWYLDANKTQNFPNFPANNEVIYRIPRSPTIPATKTLTGLGATGRMVNGVAMFDSRDAFSYVNASATDATPVNGLTGDGIWNRDGYHNEGVTFDPALAHQAGEVYHYHAHPIALRHQLGDHVDYNPLTNRYTERSGTPAAHSPIVAWAADGLPVYGPYGYSSPLDANSGIRRMISGFALRNGQNGTTAITVRQVLPLWAQRVQNRTTLTANQYGPAVNATYALGHYIEDFDYRGDLGQTLGVDFDLNEQNVRFCVTPEYPSGTWAYFTPINADGTPQYPYTTGRAYYGAVTGGSTTLAVMNADTPQTVHFLGGASTPLRVTGTNVVGTTVTLTWSTVEGGTYAVEASPNQTTWTSKATGIVATGTSTSRTYTAVGTAGTEYGRVSRTALATFDTAGSATATVAQNAVASYLLGPVGATPTIGGIASVNVLQNGSSGALAFTVGDTDTPVANLTLSASSGNTTVVPVANISFGGSGASRTVTVTPATGQTGSALITVTVSDGGTSASTSFTVTVVPAAPAITEITRTPSAPSSADTVAVTARITPPVGRTVAQARLTYQLGGSTTETSFRETMGTAAATAWTGAGVQNAWTITFTGPPASPFAQSAAANHTPVGQGNAFGMEITANAPPIANSTLTTTNPVNAAGTAAHVEFWMASSGLTGTQGWDFQTSTDGTTWTTRLSELTGNNHAYQLYHYDLTAAERVSTLRLRFRFAGPGMSNVPKVYLDDITVVRTTGVPAVTVSMADDGLHGDGPAADGVYGATIPAQAVGTSVSYFLDATDSAASAATSATFNYVVTTVPPVLTAQASSGANPGFTLNPANGIAYQIQYATNLTANAWVTIDSRTGNGSAQSFTETDPVRLARPQGYYRVFIPGSP